MDVRLKRGLGELGLAAVVAAASAAALWFGVGLAPTARLDLGPNDAHYRHGFRDDWERAGTTFFRWTDAPARLELPLAVTGEGARIRLLLRRHLTDPAEVTVTSRTLVVARESVAPGPYRWIEGPLPASRPIRVGIVWTSASPRPLGVAIDRIEVVRGSARFRPVAASMAELVLWILASLTAVRVAGAHRRVALAVAALLATAAAVTGALDPVATERILREGSATAAAVAGLAALVLASTRCRRWLGVASPRVAGWLAVAVVVGFALRAAMVLHPRFYYPDVTVHARFAGALAKHGLSAFMAEFVANQFRFSLGLQAVGEHWYAFPYPPAFYLLCWPWVRAGMAPEVAVGLAAALVNALQPLLVFGIARRLGASPAAALAAGCLAPILPIFTVRLSLAYFPALTGQAVDSLALLCLIGVALAERPTRGAWAAYVGALCVALLTYTQSLLSFAMLLPAFVVLEWSRSPGSRGRLLRLAGASLLAGVTAIAVFYGRYLPVAYDMYRGVPMPEEKLLVDLMQRRAEARPDEAVPEPPDDPHAGPGVDPWRGVRKAGARLWIFYGPFALAVGAGLVLLVRSGTPRAGRFVIAWAGTYLLLNLASGGLPGPNLVRYHKDLEIVAPLCALALGVLAEGCGRRLPRGDLAFGATFWLYGAWRYAEAFRHRLIG